MYRQCHVVIFCVIFLSLSRAKRVSQSYMSNFCKLFETTIMHTIFSERFTAFGIVS